MATKLVLGSSSPVTTGIRTATTDRNTATITVEGLYSRLKYLSPQMYALGYEVESSSLETTGDGMARLVIKGIKYDDENDQNAAPIKTTFRIDMREVQYKLQDHPNLAAKSEIEKWLATDPSKRFGQGGYYYETESGSLVEISANSAAEKFCKAYLAGIETFNRYFPIITKISIWKNPPGLTRSGRSFTGGTPTFSSHIGRFDSAPLTLSGYRAENWFKSGDRWEENANKTWTRTEEWIFAPEGSDGEHAWIYNTL